MGKRHKFAVIGLNAMPSSLAGQPMQVVPRESKHTQSTMAATDMKRLGQILVHRPCLKWPSTAMRVHPRACSLRCTTLKVTAGIRRSHCAIQGLIMLCQVFCIPDASIDAQRGLVGSVSILCQCTHHHISDDSSLELHGAQNGNISSESRSYNIAAKWGHFCQANTCSPGTPT